MPARSVKSSGDSQYEYDSQWSGDDDVGSDASDNESEYGDDVSRRTSSMSTYSGTDDAEAYLDQAKSAMKKLEDLHSQQSSYWKRALKHKSGCVVYVSKDKLDAGKKGSKGNKKYQAPVFKGEHIIKGFSPAAVFGVVGTRKLWDDWYKEGNLVENLSDTSSLTYMCMKGIAGSSTRDLSLVEIVAGSVTGTIMFASTSVTTPKVPRVSGRVRANISLNGWVLEPHDSGTRVSYYLHVNVKTFVPAFAAQKYLARRPTCVARIDEYLQSHGPPPMAGVDASSGQGGGAGMKRRGSFSSQRSKRSTRSSSAGSAVGGALIAHVATNTDAESYSEIQKASKQFHSLIGKGDWQMMLDHDGNKVFYKDGDGSIPAGKGEHILENVTTEQVLGTLLSGCARKIWDSRYAGTKLVDSHNGFDQGIYVETHKGVFPHLGKHHYTIARGVEREDAGSDNGTITFVSRSVKKDSDGPKGSKPGHLELSGWQIEEHSDREVKLIHVAELDPDEDVAPIIKKILPTEFARAPVEVNSFIDKYGYAPFFIRWGEGPATLTSDDFGDIREGFVRFDIGGEGKGTMKDGKQKCWFQWSDKMYERGIDIKVEPADAAELAKVDGMERTLEVVWTDKVKKGATMTVKRAAKGNGADDVYVGGKYLDKTVAPEKGVGGGARRAPPKKQQKSGASEGGDRQVNGKDDSQDSKKDASSGKNDGGKFAPTAAAAAAGGALAAGANRATKAFQPASATARDGNGGEGGAGGEQATKGGPFPADACLIISNDLYFTRSQVMVMGVVMAAAFLYGKFA